MAGVIAFSIAIASAEDVLKVIGTAGRIADWVACAGPERGRLIAKVLQVASQSRTWGGRLEIAQAPDGRVSAIAIDATKVFPKNTEVESVLTFVSDAPQRGSFVGDVTPDAHALTLREHQSFLELPPSGYSPRRYDPRAGYFEFAYRDYAAPLGAPLDQRFIVRHRLIKQNADCTQACLPVKPIQYYVDRGAPEPIRAALVEGARWWDQAGTLRPVR